MKGSVSSNIAQVRRDLVNDLKQERYAVVVALNGTAFAIRDKIVEVMRRVFDRPTPYVLKSVLVRKATRENLAVEVYIDFYGGGKAVAPEKILLAEVFGGQRRNKRAELALQRAGLMLPGMVMVPAAAAPTDGYGNVPGSFIVRLLAYFKTLGEEGYSGNMTDRSRAKLSGKGRWVNGRFVPATAKGYDAKAGAAAYRKGGVEYFVSHGKGERTGKGAWKNGGTQRLPAGIWQRTGLHGAVVRPVFLFVRLPSYAVRLRFFDIARELAALQFPLRLDAAREFAHRTAR